MARFGIGLGLPGPVVDAADVMRGMLRFDSPAQMAEEHKEVRVWGGIHFRNSLSVGDTMGRKLADYLLASYIKPAR